MKKNMLIISMITLLFLTGCNGNYKFNNEQVNSGGQKEMNTVSDNNKNVETEAIKNSLVKNGQYVIKSAYDNYTENDFFEYWGTSWRYGGGLTFNENDEFFYSIGIWENDSDRSGKYSIDINENKIIYNFENGRVLEGQYRIENGEVEEIIYIDYREDNPVFVILKKREKLDGIYSSNATSSDRHKEYLKFISDDEVEMYFNDYIPGSIDLYGAFGGKENTNYHLEGMYSIINNVITCRFNKFILDEPINMTLEVEGEVTIEIADSQELKLLNWIKKPLVNMPDVREEPYDVSIGEDGVIFTHNK